MNNMDIKTKLILLISTVIITVSLAVGCALLVFTRQGLFHSFEEKGLLLVDNLAYNSRYAIFSEDSASLETLIDGLFRVESVSYVVISNQQGVVLAKRQIGLPSDTMLEHLPQYKAFPKPQITAFSSHGSGPSNYYDFGMQIASLKSTVPFPSELMEETSSAPVGDPFPLGFVRIGLSTSEINSNITQSWILGLWVIGILLFCGIALSYYLASYYMREPSFGLSIAKEIVELHGGKMNVLTEKGGGSELHFSLPMSRHDKARPNKGG